MSCAASPTSAAISPQSRSPDVCCSICRIVTGAVDVGQLGEVLPDRVVQRDLSVARQQQHRGRRELLRDRPGLEDRVRRDDGPLLEIRHAIGLLEQGRSRAGDGHRASRGRRRVPLGEHRIHARRRRRERRQRPQSSVQPLTETCRTSASQRDRQGARRTSKSLTIPPWCGASRRPPRNRRSTCRVMSGRGVPSPTVGAYRRECGDARTDWRARRDRA